MKRQPGASTLSENDRRIVAVWAADCAERTLSYFENCAPSDRRPREAIEGLRAFAKGELRIGPVRALSARAHAAARDVDDPAAVAAARAGLTPAKPEGWALPGRSQVRQRPWHTWPAMRSAWATRQSLLVSPNRTIPMLRPTRPSGSFVVRLRAFGMSSDVCRRDPPARVGSVR